MFTTEHNGSPRYGGHSGRETPGTIPNPEVKPASANGTAPERMWESRTPPNNTHPMGAITRWPPSLVWGAFCVPVPSRFLRSERAWQTVVSRAARGPRAGDPRTGDRLLARRAPVVPTSLAPIGPARTVVAVVRTPREAGRAVDRPAGPLARVTGHGLLRSRVRARPTRSGTTVRRSPRRSPAASSTARSAGS